MTKFPRHFQALQVVSIEAPGRKVTLLASLERQGDDIDVTFLHPMFQSPVLGLAEHGGERKVTKYMDLPDMPFPAEAILDSIQDLYRHEGFARTDSLWGGASYVMETKAFHYDLTDVTDDKGCVFPRHIRLAAKGGVRVRLDVRTKELACVP